MQVNDHSRMSSSEVRSELLNAVRYGIVAGVLGAATIALWFLILDALSGRPLYTPMSLGAALLHEAAPGATPDRTQIIWSTVLQYSLVHWAVFVVLGTLASFGLHLRSSRRDLAFGMLLLFILFAVSEFGFRMASLFLLDTIPFLTWQAVMVGNFLGSATMGLYLLYHHGYFTRKTSLPDHTATARRQF